MKDTAERLAEALDMRNALWTKSERDAMDRILDEGEAFDYVSDLAKAHWTVSRLIEALERVHSSFAECMTNCEDCALLDSLNR